MRKILMIIMVVLILALSAFGFCVSAEQVNENQDSYLYTYWKDSVNAPAGYALDTVLDGKSLGVDSFSAPSDFYVFDKTDKLYMLDSGNGR